MEISKTKKRVLLMGWSKKSAYVVKELLSSQTINFSIDVLSVHSSAEREKALSKEIKTEKLKNVKHLELDYTQIETFEEIDMSAYCNVIFMTNDWISTGGEADARSILGVLQLRNFEENSTQKHSILVELADPKNKRLFAKRAGETIISPFVVSTILANVSIRAELGMVFEVLFNSDGADIFFKPASDYKLLGNISFSELKNKFYTQSHIPIGLRDNQTDEYIINPPSSKTISNIENYDIVSLGQP